MRTWQLQEAKAKLSELVKLCRKEPQVVSVRGKDEAILLSIEEYHSLIRKKPGLIELLQNSSLELVTPFLERDKSSSRNIDL